MSEMPYVTCADGENLHIAPFYQQVASCSCRSRIGR